MAKSPSNPWGQAKPRQAQAEAPKASGNSRFVAKTLFGLEQVLAAELRALSAQDVTVQNRAVTFAGDAELMYKANLHLRTAMRILQPVRTFRVWDDKQLYHKVQQVDWSEFLSSSDTLAVDCFANSRNFPHSQFAARRVKDAIVDQFKSQRGSRPSVDVISPTLRINLHIHEQTCTLSLDSSGESLHKRGYRLGRTQAPLSEVLAAGLILHSGWDAQSHFIDPMCGSGTIAIEATLLACNIAPGLLRQEFGFQRWKDYDAGLMTKLRDEAAGQQRDPVCKVLASDRSKPAVRTACENIERARLDDCVKISTQSFEEKKPPDAPGVLVMNPPYGERIKQDDLIPFYQMIGDRLKQAYSGYDAWILSGSKDGLKNVGLRPSKKMTLYNGPLECKFHRYQMYSGSVKSKYRQ